MYGRYMCGEGKFVADGKGEQRRFHKEALADLKIFECGVHLVCFPPSLFFASVFSVSVLHTVITFKSGEVIIENYVSLQRS